MPRPDDKRERHRQADGKFGPHAHSDPEVSLPAPPDPQPQRFMAVDHLAFPPEGDFDVSGFRAKGTERAIARLQRRKTNLIYNDASLEGFAFTEPEVVTLVEGEVTGDESDHAANVVLAISDGTNEMIDQVRTGRFALGKASSDRIHRLLASAEALDAGMFRGEGATAGSPAHVNAMGDQFDGLPPGDDGADGRALYEDELARLTATYRHPVLQAAGYAAFATYRQPYFDGNKRTARLMMNGHLMTHGIDAIVTPETRRREYNDALYRLFRDADLAAYMRFLLSCYDG